MKKIIILLSSLLVLIGLGIFASRLVANKGKSDEKIADFNFEIKDTAAIDEIAIIEPNGQKIALVRNGNQWEPKEGGCIQQHLVTNLLDAVQAGTERVRERPPGSLWEGWRHEGQRGHRPAARGVLQQPRRPVR